MARKPIRYEIWQMPVSNPNKFMHYDWCKKPPTIRDYVYVYSHELHITGKVNISDILEDIFRTLNIDEPEDYHATCLSVSDVICIKYDSGKREWWYVDGVGFEKLDWNI